MESSFVFIVLFDKENISMEQIENFLIRNNGMKKLINKLDIFLTGYGDVACNTSIGRLMTIIYAIIGIPIMLITLRDLGNFLYKAIINVIRLKHFTLSLCRIFGKTIYKTSIQQNNNDLVQLENGIPIGNGNNESDNSDNCSRKLKFHIDDEIIEG
ncbi:hypothetical protein LOAG_15400, partial [Loa loa]